MVDPKHMRKGEMVLQKGQLRGKVFHSRMVLGCWRL
jgi:hypothetical protein